MDRTIKFRGRCDKNSRYAGEWVEGGLVQCADGTTLIVSAQSDDCQSTYHVNSGTICQFTGVTDSCGNELYEHDFVRTKRNAEPLEILWNESHLAFVIKYDDQLVIKLGDILPESLTKVSNAFD